MVKRANWNLREHRESEKVKEEFMLKLLFF